MFTRNPSAEPPLRPANADANAARNAPPRPRSAEAVPKSLIGNDLKVIGRGLKVIGQAPGRSMVRSRVTSGPGRSSAASTAR
jgi:hypothetical protein